MCHLKTEIKYKSIISTFTWKFFKIKCSFLLLQTFELFDKMAKIKTIKTILMNSSDVVLKTAIITKKNIIADFTSIWTELFISMLINPMNGVNILL